MAAEALPVAGSVPSHIKQLKAAYRNAIGTKKNKNAKTTNKDEQQQDDEVVNDENSQQGQDPDLNLPAPVQDSGLMAPLNTLTPKLASPNVTLEKQQKPVQSNTGRVTRRQLAQQQAGQYNMSDFIDVQRSGLSLGKARQHPVFIKTSITGRPTGAPRWREISNSKLKDISQTNKTNDYVLSAEETFTKSMQDTNTLSLLEGRQPNGQAAYEQAIPTIETPVREVARSPPKSAIKTLEDVEQAYGKGGATSYADPEEDDSFVAQIISRSPAKSVTRIEDSVEALDQLEDAMDAIAQAALAETIVSPRKPQHKKSIEALHGQALSDRQRLPRKPSPHAARQPNPPKQQVLKSGFASVRIKPTAQKQAPGLRKSASMSFKPSATDKKVDEEQKKTQPLARTLSKRPASLMPPKEPTKSNKPPTRSTFELPGEAVARRLKEQREARLAQRESSEENVKVSRSLSGPKTIKSSKAPTKSNFELPGEALSRRKKEAHEARLKAQEEEERKRREFKARPIRRSVVPDHIPRETAASRGRQTKIETETTDINELTVSKRGSTVGAHRPSIQSINQANSSAPRAPGAKITRKPSTTSGPSMSGLAIQRTVSDKEAHTQRQRAREIYNRDARLTEEMEREKQEREAAAKRAREAAAERGRQASRDWAERQRARKLAEGDKGISAGYGPGGQLGLN